MSDIKEKLVTLPFKYSFGENGSVWLGSPSQIQAGKGSFRDGGCSLTFQTRELAIGAEHTFTLSLFAENVNEMTREMWRGYHQTEPERARRDIEEITKFLTELTASSEGQP